MNILQTKLQVIICRNVRLINFLVAPILNPHPKRDKFKVKSQTIIHKKYYNV